MPSDVFHEAFFFFTRYEAENLRTVCSDFDALSTGLRDVHGYKLRIDRMSIYFNEHFTSEPHEYIADVVAYGRTHQVSGGAEELAAGLKAAFAVSLVQHVYIQTSALSESLCDESAAFFVGVSAESVCLGRPDLPQTKSAYYETVTPSKLWNFLLSFDAIGELRLGTSLLVDDLADDFILRCRAKRVRTLTMLAGVELRTLRMQDGSEDELLWRFRALKPSLISTSR